MTDCPHDFPEREIAVTADGYCPLCLAAEIERLRNFERGALQQIEDMEAENERLQELVKMQTRARMHIDAEVERLRVERDNWEAVCSGSIKEQFRLARENEARLKLALDQLDKAAAEIERLRAALKAVAEGNWNIKRGLKPMDVHSFARRALEQARKEQR